jgi:hypothetical protein
LTIIAAMHQPGVGTWIGSDRARHDDGRQRLLTGGKWWRSGGWAIGNTGQARSRDALAQYAIEKAPPQDDIADLAVWMRRALTNDGWESRAHQGQPQYFAVDWMVATKAAIWWIGCDFAVTELSLDALHAEGSGCDLAIGYAWQRQDRPALLVQNAVRCAITFNQHCAGDPWVECVR